MQRVGDRALRWFVVLRERTIRHGTEGHEQPAQALRVHDERAHVVLGIGISLEIRHVIAGPFACSFIEPNLLAAGVPGLAFQIAGSTIVEYAPVCRPRPAPVGMDAETRRILRITTLGVRTSIRPGTAVQPVATGCGTVVF